MSDADELKEDAEAFAEEARLWLEQDRPDKALEALRVVVQIETELAALGEKGSC